MFEKLTATSRGFIIILIFIILKGFLINGQQNRRLYNNEYTPPPPGDPNYKTFVYNNRRYGSTFSNDPFFYNNPQLSGSQNPNGAYNPNIYDPNRPFGQPLPGVESDVSTLIVTCLQSYLNPNNLFFLNKILTNKI